MRSARRWGAIFVLVNCLAGCVRTPGAEVERRARLVEREQEPKRLLATARAFASVGDYTRAEQYVDAARRTGIDMDAVLPFLLDVCIKDRRYRSAVQHAEEYLRKRPTAYRVRFMLATLYMGLAENEAARRELERVLRVAPEHAYAHYTLAVLLRDELGNPAQADEHFRAYLRLAPRGAHAEAAGNSLLQRVR